MKNNKSEEAKPEFRKDPVSGDWILVAASRKKKPHNLRRGPQMKLDDDVSKCPFEDPQKSGNPFPLLWYPHPETPSAEIENLSSWFLQVIPNKFPLLFHGSDCPTPQKVGANESMPAIGHHEVIITRDHDRSLGDMTTDEIKLVFKAYKERFRVLAKDKCIKYILIFHNHGAKAGASLFHPHSQLIALPTIDPDLAGDLEGSSKYYKKNKKCLHCDMLEQDKKEKTRIITQNKHFVAVAPFSSRVTYEVRVYPKKHDSRFENLDRELFPDLAKIMKDVIARLNKGLGFPDYNFFIHTAPVNSGNQDHYHWHIEILPRGFRWAGLELGGGIEVVLVSPEDAAEYLRNC